MNSVFIGGIPAAGKSTLADKLWVSKRLQLVSIDEWRDKIFSKDEKLSPWVDFFWNQNEREYWDKTSCEDHWGNLVNQSEAFWPTIVKKVREITQEENIIIEGVNILPHLAAKDFKFSGIFLVGESMEHIFDRLRQEPRWGETEELQKSEAERFFLCEGPKIEKEASKYGYKTFSNIEAAEIELLNLIG